MSTPAMRLRALETLFAAPEYVAEAKRVGIYGELLAWVAATRRGEYAVWPRPGGAPTVAPPPQAVGGMGPAARMVPQIPRGPPATLPPPPTMTRAPAAFAPPPSQRPLMRIAETTGGGAGAGAGAGARAGPGHFVGSAAAGQTALATVSPPKRALDVLHESYGLLGLDDSTPLTHDLLRAAYKRAAIKTHPDKGGSKVAFDAVSRAYLYVEEVLNKLLPSNRAEKADPRYTMTTASAAAAAAHEDDHRFTMAVTPESAMRARGDFGGGGGSVAAAASMRLEDAPPIALNPKKLDLAMFNKLFEENRLPDPDADGYGSWLKSNEGRASSTELMGGKFSKDAFNKVFEEEARKATAAAANKYKPPSDLTLAPSFGTEIGSARPDQYTKATGSALGGAGLAYTDLMHAYGDGSTFSQEVADVDMSGRPQTLEQAKAEYGAAPKALSAEEAAAVRGAEMAREQAEMMRRQRVAARDVDAESAHARLKGRMTIRE